MPSLSPAPTCPILTGLSEIAHRYDLLLCDVWGVLHDGKRAFTEPSEALRRFRQGGGSVVLLTNAPRPNGSVVVQIDELGVPRAAYDAIVTSGDVTVALLAARGTGPFFHIGPERDLALFAEVESRTGVRPVLTALEEAACVACTGLFDDRMEGPDDYRDMFAAMRRRNLDMICANPDHVVHVGSKLIYCAGALAHRYEEGGGRTFYAGKPHAPIYDYALTLASEARGRPIPRERVLAIGDGMRTDIAGASGQGLDTLFVLSGIHGSETSASEGGFDPISAQAFLSTSDHAPSAAIHSLRW